MAFTTVDEIAVLYGGNMEQIKNINKILAEENINEIEKKLKEQGIKIRKWNGRYKTWYQIFKEINKKWNKISE